MAKENLITAEHERDLLFIEKKTIKTLTNI